MNNILYKGVIIDPSEFLMPKIRVSPLNQSDFSCTIDTVDDNAVLKIKDFGGKYVSLGIKARHLLDYALSLCKLDFDDVVTILTTSGNLYVSSCVTREVEKYCKWSRHISEKTKAIIVIHEFGYAYSDVRTLLRYNVPIIEDCSYSFLTEANDIGKYGDFSIYSLPKIFPMQVGAVMASRNPVFYHIDTIYMDYINSFVIRNLGKIDDIKSKRISNHCYLEKELKPLGITPFFSLNDKTVPGVFLFKWYDYINYQELKEFLTNNGIECSVFYGQNAFFVPVHQNLSKSELDYMVKLIYYFYEQIV